MFINSPVLIINLVNKTKKGLIFLTYYLSLDLMILSVLSVLKHYRSCTEKATIKNNKNNYIQRLDLCVP